MSVKGPREVREGGGGNGGEGTAFLPSLRLRNSHVAVAVWPLGCSSGASCHKAAAAAERCLLLCAHQGACVLGCVCGRTPDNRCSDIRQ